MKRGPVYRWIDHTAEAELRIEADCPEEVIATALAALSEVLGEPDRSREAITETVAVDAPDRPALLAAWLEELVFMAESRGLICERLTEIELDELTLRATVEATPGRARHLVKAVTYHGLRFERAADGWVATAVLDV